MMTGVRQRGQPRAFSSTSAAHDAQKRWWLQGTSAWRASRFSTRQTSQRSGGCTAADGVTLLGSLIATNCGDVLCVATCIAEPHSPCSLLIVSAVTLIVCEQTPMVGADFGDFHVVKTCIAELCHPWNLLSGFGCYINRSWADTFVCNWYQLASSVECYYNRIITRFSIQTAGLAFGGTGRCSYRVRGVGGSCAEHLTVESYTIIISLESYLLSYLLLLVFHHPLTLSL